MQLNIQERFRLLNVLSGAAGNLATLRIVRDLQQELGLSEEEHKAINLRHDGDQVRWDDGKVPPKDVSVGPAALDTALAMFKRMEQTETLKIEYLPIYERLLKEKHETTSKPKLAAV